MPRKQPKPARRPRTLVLGYLERISSRAFSAYADEITELVGRRHGIYALYRNNNLYYVGLATNLRNRVRQHLRDRHAGKWNYFSLYIVRNEKHLRELESLAMRIADPRGNTWRGRLPGAADLRRQLKRRMTESARAEIVQILSSGRKRGGAAPPPGPRQTAGRKAAATRRARLKARVPLCGIIANVPLRARHDGRLVRARVLSSGRIKLRDNGEIFDSPSGAAVAVLGRKRDGWSWWSYRDRQGEWRRLRELRK